MQEMKYSELENRASAEPERLDALKQLEARARVKHVIDQMRETGEALTLTDEEERMLWSFRRFKLRMRKNGEVFKWQSALPTGVQVVSETDLQRRHRQR